MTMILSAEKEEEEEEQQQQAARRVAMAWKRTDRRLPPSVFGCLGFERD
jgi:uncharacterized membrane protein YidH (DUF202 family)